MKHIASVFSLFLILSFLLLSVPLHAQKGWFEKHKEGEDILFSVGCLDASVIVAVGSDGLLLRSGDAGGSWQEISNGATDVLRRVRWYSADLGVVLGNGGVAMKSTDAGLSWQMLTTGTSDALFDVHFFDADNWMVVGRGARVLSTTDGGATFTNESSGLNNYNEIAFRGDVGIIVGNKGTIRRTVNGGEKWSKSSSGTDLELTGVSFGDDSTIVVCGINGTILRSTDYGKTWNPATANLPLSAYRLSGVQHLTRNHAVIAAYGGIVLESWDAGQTWTAQESNTDVNLESVSFIDSKTGCVAGWNTTVMRTTSGGTLAVNRIEAQYPSRVSISSTWPQPVSRSATGVAHVAVDVVRGGMVTLRVHDLLGRQITTLFEESCSPGRWDISWDPSTLSNGIYLYRLTTHDEVRVAKFTVVN
ncbi:hypothetical protein KQI65_05130 [bacterium]|nr:hypothetical protein [bacterium]